MKTVKQKNQGSSVKRKQTITHSSHTHPQTTLCPVNHSLLFVILLCVIDTVNCQSLPDYVCPNECQCATLPDDYTAVQLVCHMPFIANYSSNFSVIASEHTTWLTVVCTADFFTSHIQPDAFSHLSDLQELSILFCRFNVISR